MGRVSVWVWACVCFGVGVGGCVGVDGACVACLVCVLCVFAFIVPCFEIRLFNMFSLQFIVLSFQFLLFLRKSGRS